MRHFIFAFALAGLADAFPAQPSGAAQLIF
jgi:hypothetical protein